MPEGLVDGGGDVVDVVELVAQIAPGGDAVRPVHDERDVDAAFVGVLLVPLERCVAGLGPAPRVVRVAVGPADVVDPLDGLVGGLDHEVEVLHLVHDAERPALLAGSVVRQQDEERVVESTELLQVRRPGGRSGRRCARGTRRRPPAGGRPGDVGSRAACPTPPLPDCAGRAGCRPGAGPSPAGGRTTCRGPRPTRRRIAPGTSRGSRRGPDGVRAWRRRRDRRRRDGPGRIGRGVVDEADGVVDQVLAQVVALVRRGRRLDASGCRRPARDRTGRSHPRGTRSSGRTRAGRATGRRDRPPTHSPCCTGATSPTRRWHSPRPAGPRPRWRRGW